ncbi:hypothetical protein ACGFZG_02850 [Streptomyces antibioticus]|uniref:hypothetical protein n=1 Tax=Streptomyces antibioticus TaxID=1890 RepID=UPI0036F7F240
MNGILDESRSHGIREECKDDETAVIMEQNKQAEWRKTLMTGVLTAGVAGGTALVLGPAAGVVATTVVPVVMKSGASTISTAYATTRWSISRTTNTRTTLRHCRMCSASNTPGSGAWSPVRNYAIAIGMTQAEQLALNHEIEQSYLAGKSAISSNEKVSA